MNTTTELSSAAADELITIRPNYKSRFKPSVAQKIIHQILQERLSGKVYDPEEASQWTRAISDEIRTKLKELNLERYKYVVQVVIGELRGEGARMNCRCFWDPDSDNVAQDLFTNNTMFCVAAAFGVYFY